MEFLLIPPVEITTIKTLLTGNLSIIMSDFHNNPVAVEQIPQFEALTFLPLDKNYPLLNSIEALIGWLVILIPLTVLTFWFDNILVPIWILPLVSSLALLSCLYAYWSAKSRGYILREHDVLYKEGVWWRKRTGVSFKRIQHIDVTHGPVERKFNMASIKFFTAGGSLADLKIPGLPKSQAEQIRTLILENTGNTDAE